MCPAWSRTGILVLVTVVVGAVLAVSALWVVDSGDTGEPVGLNASDQYAEVGSITATRVTVVERGDERVRTVANVTTVPGTDRRRIDVVESTDRRYDLTVANGSMLWLYDRDEEFVKRIPLSGDPSTGLATGERIEQLFSQLNVTAGAEPTTVSVEPSVSPLPTVPRGSSTPSEAVTGPMAVRYEGTATVDGREAYALELAAGDGTDDGSGDEAAYRQTLLVDTEWFVPLERETTWTDDGERVTVRTTYRNVTFDPSVPDGTFTFEPPASAEVESVGTPETTTYGSIAALRADTSVAVPEPAVPPSFDLTHAAQTEGRIRSVDLEYEDETSWLAVSKYNRTVETDGDRQVDIDGREGQLSLGSPLSLSWTCDEYRYTVRAERVPTDRVVDVARSIGCS